MRGNQTEGRRTQAERRSQSEEALLDAAAELIVERGVDRASLGTIGTRAGASRGLPTHYFRSKDTMVARLAERAQERIGAATVKDLAQEHRSFADLSALEQVQITVDSYLEILDHPAPDQRALIVMWGSTFPSGSSVEGMVEADRRSYDELAQVMARGQREGSVRHDLDPASAAVVLLGMMRGIAALLLTDSTIIDVRGARRTCHDWITTALQPVTSDADRAASNITRTRDEGNSRCQHTT